MITAEQSWADRLEACVDTQGFADVLAELARIAESKAAHLRENWQDERTAAEWEKAGRRVWMAWTWIAKNTHL